MSAHRRSFIWTPERSRRQQASVVKVRAAANRTAVAEGPQRSLGDLPLPSGEWTANIPVFGETVGYLKDHMAWCHERVSKHGPVFKTHLFGYSCYALTDFESIDMIYDQIHKTTKQFHPDSFRELMGQSGAIAMTYHREAHLKMRRQIGAALSGDAVAAALPRLEQIVRGRLENWASQEHVDLEQAMGDMAMDFSNNVVVGLGMDADDKLAVRDQFKIFTNNLFSLKIDLPGTPFYQAKQARKLIMSQIRGHVKRMREDALAGKFADRKTRMTTLQNYLVMQIADGDPLNIDTLAETCLGLLVAGSDTSAWSLLVLLALLPQMPSRILQKLSEEQARVIKEHGPAFTKEAMADMKYTEAVVKEGLRIKGPVSFGLKQTTQDIQIHGKRIPANSVIFMSVIYALASDPKVLRDEKVGGCLPSTMDIYNLEKAFVPERWLDPDTVPESLGQFASGAHSCLGAPLYYQEAKLLLSVLAREYDMTLVKPGAVKWVPTTQIKPVEPIHMRFIQRNGPADSAPDLSDRVQTDASTPVELTVT